MSNDANSDFVNWLKRKVNYEFCGKKKSDQNYFLENKKSFIDLLAVGLCGK